jgi:cation diffusion facilitator family transporter
MHVQTLNHWMHEHRFGINGKGAERSTWRVIALTVTMMVVEIAAGTVFGSMALLADGWHMGTHAFALAITAFAYVYARRKACDPGFSFGTGKVGVLGGYTSAVVLAIVALLMAVEAVKRLISPNPIRFNEAIAVAILGLVVNLVSAVVLHGGHSHAHPHDNHEHSGDGHGHHEDHNLKAAYLHVVADAMTSLLAIAGLLAGKSLGWTWMDPMMGIVGSVVIARWAWGLLRDTSEILLDSGVDRQISAEVRAAIEGDADNRIADLHLWHLSSNDVAAIINVVTHYPRPPEYYRSLLSGICELAHVTIEVNRPSGEPCMPVPWLAPAAMETAGLWPSANKAQAG